MQNHERVCTKPLTTFWPLGAFLTEGIPHLYNVYIYIGMHVYSVFLRSTLTKYRKPLKQVCVALSFKYMQTLSHIYIYIYIKQTMTTTSLLFLCVEKPKRLIKPNKHQNLEKTNKNNLLGESLVPAPNRFFLVFSSLWLCLFSLTFCFLTLSLTQKIQSNSSLVFLEEQMFTNQQKLDVWFCLFVL